MRNDPNPSARALEQSKASVSRQAAAGRPAPLGSRSSANERLLRGSELIEKRAERARQRLLDCVWQLAPLATARVTNMRSVDLSLAVHQVRRGKHRDAFRWQV